MEGIGLNPSRNGFYYPEFLPLQILQSIENFQVPAQDQVQLTPDDEILFHLLSPYLGQGSDLELVKLMVLCRQNGLVPAVVGVPVITSQETQIIAITATCANTEETARPEENVYPAVQVVEGVNGETYAIAKIQDGIDPLSVTDRDPETNKIIVTNFDPMPKVKAVFQAYGVKDGGLIHVYPAAVDGGNSFASLEFATVDQLNAALEAVVNEYGLCSVMTFDVVAARNGVRNLNLKLEDGTNLQICINSLPGAQDQYFPVAALSEVAKNDLLTELNANTSSRNVKLVGENIEGDLLAINVKNGEDAVLGGSSVSGEVVAAIVTEEKAKELAPQSTNQKRPETIAPVLEVGLSLVLIGAFITASFLRNNIAEKLHSLRIKRLENQALRSNAKSYIGIITDYLAGNNLRVIDLLSANDAVSRYVYDYEVRTGRRKFSSILKQNFKDYLRGELLRRNKRLKGQERKDMQLRIYEIIELFFSDDRNYHKISQLVLEANLEVETLSQLKTKYPRLKLVDRSSSLPVTVSSQQRTVAPHNEKRKNGHTPQQPEKDTNRVVGKSHLIEPLLNQEGIRVDEYLELLNWMRSIDNWGSLRMTGINGSWSESLDVEFKKYMIEPGALSKGTLEFAFTSDAKKRIDKVYRDLEVQGLNPRIRRRTGKKIDLPEGKRGHFIRVDFDGNDGERRTRLLIIVTSHNHNSAR